MINNGDASLGTAYGLDPDMFVGYQAEYRWAQSYQQTYGNAPGKEALLSKFSDFPYTEHDDAAFAADEVRYTHNQRELRRAVRSAAQSIAEGDYEDAALALGSYTPQLARQPLQNALYDLSFLESYGDKPDGIEWPWPTLQAVTGGLRIGDLAYFAARLGQGKSWNVLEAVAHALLQNRSVALYTLEMAKEQVLIRLHVVLGRRLGVAVDHVAMRDKVYDVIAYRKLVAKIKEEVPGTLYLFDASDGKTTPATVAARAGDVDLNVIDYCGLMGSSMGKRAVDDWRLMATISNELKEISVAKKSRVLALAQVNREGDTLSRYPPKVKNLAQSDSLGQDGDLVITHKQYSHTSQVFSIEKNRHGASGLYYFSRFLPNEGGFWEISRDTADDLRDREED